MDDLTGTADERMHQLATLEASGPLDAAWLRRQLDLTLQAWASDETELDIERESHTDF
ncbi:hypothetical protein M2152_000210 [Microbacteriaceae bacterium SG_E_30_P1]|uniref:Uncharacterized protein n=1 Tax=Antiquaquibacter oligotrophicus TaxID=2880260 RepID=A0ABT6KJB7_9MICO|nr:hypothetical protein [Antiquaquibacter oligotrophicus]MDH6180028.1 hypothetical protein [Antiquaquibacter oligotrophicus]UDF14218.1 hypothetical protein LH407_04985 [Antiquaquibacter oligotrophicus]